MTLADAFSRHAIGLDRLSRFVEAANTGPNYPPHNIEQVGENSYTLTLAVAGFTRDDITITRHNNVLEITGRKETDYPAGTLVYRGISLRSFTRCFTLDDQIEIRDVTLKDGLLVIATERVVPEEQKPKRILIN